MVSVEWLAKNIGNKDILVVDATWCMPSDAEPHPGTFIDGVQFDIDKIARASSVFPHTLPNPEVFEKHVRELGINNNTLIICYDRHGLFSAPRAWWMFRVMGHEKINVLDGGLPAWLAAGLPTIDKYSTPNTGNFCTDYRPSLFKRTDDIRAALNNEQILDARPKGRFDGTAPEPRVNLSSGHMPGATSIPFSDLKTASGFLKTAAELKKMLAVRSVDLTAPIISTCGSGITACAIAISLARVGVWDTAVYDGSWTEWASTDGCPIEKVC
jgi:thiosulfate/3-mercaptopyruvate sulfurtransferase